MKQIWRAHGQYQSTVILVSFLSLFSEIVCVNLINPGKNPQIKIKKWLEMGDMDWQDPMITGPPDQSTDLISIINDTTYVFSQNLISVIISCEAPYPVHWTSNLGQRFPLHGSMLLRGRSSRQSDSISDTSSFVFSSDLLFRGSIKEFTGNYTCHKVHDPSFNSSVYMFWESMSPISLVLAKKAVTIEISGQEKILELPCLTTVPDVEVYLYKSFVDNFFVEKFELVHQNDSIQFDPKIGFIIDQKAVSDPYGKYRCTTNETNDYVDLLVVKTIDPGSGGISNNDDVTERKQKGTQFAYDETKGTLMCCSRSGVPVIKTDLCFDLVVCHLTDTKSPYTINTTLKQDSLLFHNRQLTREWMNGTCRLSQLSSGLLGRFQCTGQGINIVRTLYTSLLVGVNNTFNLYQSWDEIKAEDFLKIVVNEVDYPWFHGQVNKGVRNWNRRKYHRPAFIPTTGKLPDKVFAGETINFTCKASVNYFAFGSRFAIRWKNRPLQEIDAVNHTKREKDLRNNFMRLSRRGYAYSFQKTSKETVGIQMHIDMVAIVCYAPVHNDTRWVSKEMLLHVQDPVLPTMVSGDENVYWTLNETEKSMKCAAQGEPVPVLSFQLNGKDVVNNNSTQLETVNGTLILTLHQVSYESHGEYQCIASNFAGMAVKKINVFVEASTHWTSIITVVVISVVLVLVFLVVAWKFQLQKKILSRMHRDGPYQD